MRVLITGASGMLGTDLVSALQSKFQVTGLCRREVPLKIPYHRFDLLDKDKMKKITQQEKPDILLHSAAFTQVDACELDRQSALRGNLEATQSVVEAANAVQAPVVLFSTDYVFDGKKKGEYREDDIPNPRSIYGETKLLAEEYIQRNAASYLIIRISWLYGIHGRSFPRTILERAVSQSRFEVVEDQVGRPTYTKDVAAALSHLLERGTGFIKERSNRIYHFSNQGQGVSWADFARFLLLKAGFQKAEVVSIKSDQLSRPAKRPENSVLSTQKTAMELGIELRPWQEAAADFIECFYGRKSEASCERN